VVLGIFTYNRGTYICVLPKFNRRHHFIIKLDWWNLWQPSLIEKFSYFIWKEPKTLEENNLGFTPFYYIYIIIFCRGDLNTKDLLLNLWDSQECLPGIHLLRLVSLILWPRATTNQIISHLKSFVITCHQWIMINQIYYIKVPLRRRIS